MPVRLKRSEPREKGWAAKPEAAGIAHGAADLGAAEAAADLRVDAERQEMVAVGGGDLLADEHQRAPVPAFFATPFCLERVVVGEQHDVDPGALRRERDLGHGSSAIRVRGMHVDDASQVVRFGHGRH